MAEYDLHDMPTDKDKIEILLAEVTGEIEEISEQILTEDGDDDWARRARAARAARFKVKALLERRLQAFDPPRPIEVDPIEMARLDVERERLRVKALEIEASERNAKAAADIAERAHAAKQSRVDQSNSEQRRRNVAVMAFLRTDYPVVYSRANAMLEDLQASWAAKDAEARAE